MKKKLWQLMKLVLGLSIISLIYFKIGITETVNALKNISPLYFLLALVFCLFFFIISTWNLKVSSDILLKIDYSKLMHYFLLSWSWGLIAPGKIGELSYAYYIKKHDIYFGQGLAIVISDKLITVFYLSIIASFAFFLFFDLATALTLTTMVLSGIAVAIILLFNNRFKEFIRTRIVRKFSKNLKGFNKLLTKILTTKKILGIKIGLSFLKWLFAALIMWSLLLSVGVSVNIFIIYLFSAITSIVSLIPLTPSGIGTKEGIGIYLYSLLGISPIVIGAVYILMNVINYLIAGGYILVSRDIK